MKRMLSILLALSFLFTLCACGADASRPVSSGEPTGQTGSDPNRGEDAGPAVLAEAVYPAMAPRPREEDYVREGGWDLDESFYEAARAWREDLAALRLQPEGYAASLDPWLAGCIRQFLSGGEDGNRVVSPLNITMALAMLAEVTDGNTRQQILDLLGAEDLDALRSTAHALWLQSYQNDGQTSSILANALFLAREPDYVPETLEKLSALYFASAFRGQMGSPEYDALLQRWINEQTGGLLSGPASALHMDPQTVLALASTLYFKSPWTSSFSENGTESGVFHAPGGDMTVDFMHRSDSRVYYWGEHFGAVGLEMENGGLMWFLLPDEGFRPEDLLEDEEALAFLLSRDKSGWEKQKDLLVRLSLPKFDVSSDLDLIRGLQALGLSDLFDPAVSDFSPLIRDSVPLFVSRVEHAARVLIDEEGCEAAAFTVIMVAAGMAPPPDDSLDFVLDRPFLFCVTNAGGLPLFTGLVNEPAA